MDFELLVVFLLGTAPISEVRGAVAFGLGVGLNPWLVFIIAYIGSVIPIFPLLYLIDRVVKTLSRRFTVFSRFFTWLFERTHKNSRDYFTRWGQMGLVLFVAIPLPMTGAWTGSVASYLFGFPKFRSFLLISLGSALAGIISLGIVSAIISFIRYIGA